MPIDFDFDLAVWHLVNLAVAYVLGMLIGWDQEHRSRSAGLRTFPLVAAGACGFVLLGVSVLGAESNAIARVLQGLITGIGFLGGGVILKRDGRAVGLATAASLWNTCGIGACVGLGRYEIAVVLALANFFTLRWVSQLKAQIDPKRGTDDADEAGGGGGRDD